MTGYFPGANPFAPDTTPPLDGSLTLGDWLRKSYDPSFKPQPYVKPGGIADYADMKREDYAKPAAAPPAPRAAQQAAANLPTETGASSTAPVTRPRPQVSAETFAGLGSRAYQSSPEWGGVRINGLGEQGSDAGPEPTYRTDPLLTQGQMAQDFSARGFINARHAQAMGGIEEYSKRNDPQREAIEARAKTLGYESMMPYGSESKMSVDYLDGKGLQDFPQRNAPEGATRGQVQAIETNPKVRGELQQQRAADAGAAGFMELRERLFKNGATPEEAEAALAKYAMDAAREYAVRTGTYGPWAQMLNANKFGEGALPPEQAVR